MDKKRAEIEKNRREWLIDVNTGNRQYLDKFIEISQLIETKFPDQDLKNKDIILQLYDSSFCLDLEVAIFDLIPPDNFSVKERFVLFTCAWIFRSGYSGIYDSRIKGKRDRFNKSMIEKILEEVEFDDDIKKAIFQVSEYAIYTELNCITKNSSGLRLRLVGACLVLVEAFYEAICIGKKKTIKWADNIFIELIPDESNINEEIYFHWLKRSIAIENRNYRPVEKSIVHPNKDKGGTIYNVTVFPINSIFKDEESFQHNLKLSLTSYFKNILFSFKQVVMAYLRVITSDEDILKINNVINRKRVNFFSTHVEIDFDDKKESDYQDTLGNDDLKIINLVSNILYHQKASASILAKDFIDVLKFLINKGENDAKIVDAIRKFDEEVLTNYLRNNRPCHVILQKVQKLIKNIDTSNIKQIEKGLDKYIESRKQIPLKIYKNLVPLLSQIKSILVFGYSETVIKSLDLFINDRDEFNNLKFPDAKNIVLYVGACESKNRFNLQGELVHGDGISYRDKLESLGFCSVILIPDTCIGNLINRKTNNKELRNDNHSVDLVLLGANGINPKTMDFGHTAGHDIVVDFALEKKTPVYILADSWKIGEFKFNPNVTRKSRWLPPKHFNKLSERKIFIPRESILPIFPKVKNGFQFLITDKGIFVTGDIEEDSISNFEEVKVEDITYRNAWFNFFK